MQGLRGILSCASCRQRKLKCDRNEPCSNCLARNVECKYAPLPRGRASAQRQHSNHQLEARLGHLEQLIGTLVAQRSSGHESQAAIHNQDPDDPAIVDRDILRSNPDTQVGRSDSSIQVQPGQMVESNNQMTYVSSHHWIAIQTEIAKVREFVELATPSDLPEVTEQPPKGPILLEGTCNSSIDEILADFPSRDVADRLVSRFFSSTEPSIVAIHAPTFQKEYQRFWLDQQNAPQPWIALVFGIMFMGTFLYVRSKDELPGSLSDPILVLDTFRRRAAECLILSKYSTQPTTYTLEALLLNIQCEFVRQPDAHLGVWVLSSVATRLAMRMGYHRDPKNYKQISPFHGEMRRRVWAIVIQLDTLTSCQLGLPSMIHAPQCDTELPCNLRNEDFDESCTALPPPRPETDLTPILYTISKARLLAVFGAIFDQVCLVRPERYEQIMVLDQQLHATYTSISPCLRIINMQDFITVPPDVLIKRYHIELLYHKSRCILHRQHMTKSYHNHEFVYSRLSCLDAAMMLLTHQENIFKEVQPGGILFRDKWFLTSLEQHDFILASMIICLEISSHPRQVAIEGQMSEKRLPEYTREQLINAVKKSRRFFGEFTSNSAEALQAFRVCSVLLDKVVNSLGEQDEHPPTTTLGQGLQNGHTPFQIDDIQMSQGGAEQTHASQSTFTPRLDAIGGMLDSPDLVDWDLWEVYIQESRLGTEL